MTLASSLSRCGSALLLSLATTLALPAQTTLTGTVLDAATGAPIEFATVMLTRAADSSMVGGTTTEPDGGFAVSAAGEDPAGLTLAISFIGFEETRVDVAGFGESRTAEGVIDVGEVRLATAGLLLDELVVRAERSQTTFELDKRVFNVGKDLASSGANALEVLDNVPSVNVDIDGTVSLRGASGVQILINGKPSVLTSEGNNALSTLTADMIERVEVITNPSAKYEAEGSGGILNVVIKKDERRGLNGAVSVNGGIPANHSVGLSLNRRTERFNLFSQLGVGYRERPTETISENRNLREQTLVRSTGTEDRQELFYNLVLGTDYRPSERDLITLSGNFAYEVEDQPSAFDFARTDLATGATLARWRRTEATEATNPKYQFDLQWSRDFRAGEEDGERPRRGDRPRGARTADGEDDGKGGGAPRDRPNRPGAKDDRDHLLVTSLTGSLFAKDQSSLFENVTVEGVLEQAARQRTRTDFGEVETTAKVDYTRPVGETMVVETGAQFVANDVSNDFAVANDVGGAFVGDPGLTNVFDWNQRVLGVYATAAEQFGKLGLKGGLRVEHTDLETLLRTTDETNDQRYTDLFPSAAASYELRPGISVQASYSRRISRPRLWDLNPFFNIRNNFSYRVGNPDLGPEYADSYEGTAVFIFDKMSFNTGLYHRRTTDLVERVTTFEDNVSITQPVNVGTENSTGLEVNGQYTASKQLTFRGDLNASVFAREGSFRTQDFDFTGRALSGRLSAKLRLPFELEAELTGRYRAGFETFQGRVGEQAWMDLGLRQPLWGGRGSLNVSIRDVLASRVRETFVVQEDFETYDFGQRGRFITAGFSYGFGKGDTMEYGGQRRRS